MQKPQIKYKIIEAFCISSSIIVILSPIQLFSPNFQPWKYLLRYFRSTTFHMESYHKINMYKVIITIRAPRTGAQNIHFAAPYCASQPLPYLLQHNPKHKLNCLSALNGSVYWFNLFNTPFTVRSRWWAGPLNSACIFHICSLQHSCIPPLNTPYCLSFSSPALAIVFDTPKNPPCRRPCDQA